MRSLRLLAASALVATIAMGTASCDRPRFGAPANREPVPLSMAIRTEPATMDDALYNRTYGLRACARQDWHECYRRLENAKSLDSKYEQDPEVTKALAAADVSFEMENARRLHEDQIDPE